jgi:dynein heavy chain, axonemal
VGDFLEVIGRYPIVPRPEIFGLHDNADITSDQNETYDLFATVLSLQPRVASGGGISRDDVISHQCEAIMAKVPQLFDIEAVQNSYPTMYEESMNTVLVQECIRCALAVQTYSIAGQGHTVPACEQ